MTWLFQYKSFIFENWKHYRIYLLNVAGFKVFYYSSNAIASFCFVYVILFAICLFRTLQRAHVGGLRCCTFWPLEGSAVLKIDDSFPEAVPQMLRLHFKNIIQTVNFAHQIQRAGREERSIEPGLWLAVKTTSSKFAMTLNRNNFIHLIKLLQFVYHKRNSKDTSYLLIDFIYLLIRCDLAFFTQADTSVWCLYGSLD